LKRRPPRGRYRLVLCWKQSWPVGMERRGLLGPLRRVCTDTVDAMTPTTGQGTLPCRAPSVARLSACCASQALLALSRRRLNPSRSLVSGSGVGDMGSPHVARWARRPPALGCQPGVAGLLRVLATEARPARRPAPPVRRRPEGGANDSPGSGGISGSTPTSVTRQGCSGPSSTQSRGRSTWRLGNTSVPVDPMPAPAARGFMAEAARCWRLTSNNAPDLG
jgi:hypothetical protein